MAEIKNPKAYFKRVVSNSYKDEYRANDNFYDHIDSVGDEHDIQRKCAPEEATKENGPGLIERMLADASTENWLLLMENEQLHNALRSLPPADVEFLLELSQNRFNKSDFAKRHGISQQAVSKRFSRLRKKILENLEIGL